MCKTAHPNPPGTHASVFINRQSNVSCLRRLIGAGTQAPYVFITCFQRQRPAVRLRLKAHIRQDSSPVNQHKWPIATLTAIGTQAAGVYGVAGLIRQAVVPAPSGD